MAEVNKMTVVIPAGCVRIDFGMEAWNWEWLKLMLVLVPQINTFVESKPLGLIHHGGFRRRYLRLPPFTFPFRVEIGFTQFWMSFEDFKNAARTPTHLEWCKHFQDPKTGFYHEAYEVIEAVYVNMPRRVGVGAFLELVPANGVLASATGRCEARRATMRTAVSPGQSLSAHSLRFGA
jgi:hypothetical protein